MLAALGIPPRDVMRLLGHSNIRTTLGLYTFSTDNIRKEAMKKYGSLIFGEDA